MLSRVLSGAVLGIDAYLVRVEADVSNGLPTFATVGLAQGALKESEKRVVAAVKNSGFEFPPKRIVINLAPADATNERRNAALWKDPGDAVDHGVDPDTMPFISKPCEQSDLLTTRERVVTGQPAISIPSRCAVSSMTGFLRWRGSGAP
jgi:hypothetical protein